MKLVASILALALAVQPAAAPLSNRRAILAEHRLEITETPQGYFGPGWDRLIEEATDAQFFLVGEQHATRDLALFATRLHAALARRGYTHGAVEVGPWAFDYYFAIGNVRAATPVATLPGSP